MREEDTAWPVGFNYTRVQCGGWQAEDAITQLIILKQQTAASLKGLCPWGHRVVMLPQDLAFLPCWYRLWNLLHEPPFFSPQDVIKSPPPLQPSLGP